MKNIKTYLKKNVFFVFLLTVILLIIIALSVYIFVNTQAQQEPVKPVVTTPEPAPAKTTAEITQFEGEYRKAVSYTHLDVYKRQFIRWATDTWHRL